MAIITEIELIDYLNTTSLKYKVKGSEIVLKNCPYCETKGNYSHFYFSRDKGCFYCHKCGEKGNLNKFKLDRGDITPVTKARNITYKKPIEDKTLISDTDKFYDWYYKERGIKPEILKNYSVGFKRIDYQTILVYQYFDSKGVLFSRKYRSVDKKKIWTEKEAEKNYYGLQFINYNKGTLHVCEGEDDCHTLSQLCIDNVVSVPYGAGSYTLAMDVINEKFDAIYLLFDNDQRGQEGAYNFAKKAGLHKCKNVILPFKDSRECILNGLDIFDMQKHINLAKVFKHDDIIKAGDVSENLKNNIFHSEKLLGRAIEISQFNEIVGGVRLSELSIITGHTGSGKSTFAYNFAAWCERVGFGVMTLSFENKLESVIKKFIEIYSQKSIFNYDFVSCKWIIGENEVWIDKQLDLLNSKNLYFLNKSYGKNGYYDLTRIGEIIEFAVKFYNVNIFVIDHLHYFLKLSGSRNPVLVIDETIRQMKIWTEQYNIHIALIVHPHKIEDSRSGKPVKLGLMSPKGASSISQEADNFMVVSRPVKAEGKAEELKSKIEICKNRETGKPGTIFMDVLENRNTFISGTGENRQENWQDGF